MVKANEYIAVRAYYSYTPTRTVKLLVEHVAFPAVKGKDFHSLLTLSHGVSQLGKR